MARALLRLLPLALAAACVAPGSGAGPGEPAPRTGDEIVVCGAFFHTGARVVLWLDPGGFDAYRTHPRFREGDGTEAARYGTYRRHLPPDVDARVHENGWRLEDLQRVVRRLVIHYDAAGTSRRCFEVLQDLRRLSTHFLIDRDGTIYQTLDAKERAWHAGPANDDSLGVELANVGAYADPAELRRIYRAVGLPGDPAAVTGAIHGTTLHQYPFTDAQYDALARLTAALSRVLPRIRPAAPADRGGLCDPSFAGVVGHYHLTKQKVDPGPAFDWDRYLDLVGSHSRPTGYSR